MTKANRLREAAESKFKKKELRVDAAMTEHRKAGCSEATEAKFMKEAEGILTAEQYAKFKAECKSEKDKTKA